MESYCALPLDEGLFTHIMGKAKGWGMVLYEQVIFYSARMSNTDNLLCIGLVGNNLYEHAGHTKQRQQFSKLVVEYG